jgi:hypothetical protein
VGALGTAGALLVALRLLVRDRNNADRAQVDLVAVWAEPDYERQGAQATIHLYVRNGSDLPVNVLDLYYVIHTRWLVPPKGPDDWGGYDSIEGTPQPSAFPPGEFQVRPHETWHSTVLEGLAETAPEGALQLDPEKGVRPEIDYLLILDNAGRKWRVQPSRVGRAKALKP